MKIFEFKTITKGNNGRPFLIAFPANKIEKIESQVGSQNVFLRINNIEVDGSYEDFIKELSNYNQSIDIEKK